MELNYFYSVLRIRLYLFGNTCILYEIVYEKILPTHVSTKTLFIYFSLLIYNIFWYDASYLSCCKNVLFIDNMSGYHGDGMLYVCLALAQFPDKHPYSP